jgi:hypothetical protein
MIGYAHRRVDPHSVSNMPEPEPTPLRLRLGSRSEISFRPQFDEALDGVNLEASLDQAFSMDEHAILRPASPAERVLAPEVLPSSPLAPKAGPRSAAREDVQRAVDETARRVDRWILEQRQRLADGLDIMLAQVQEQRKLEVARLEAWKTEERERVVRDLTEEKELFHARLMEELVTFEHQLGERLREQEERLAKWWDEAEQVTKQRFAELSAPPSAEAGESPRS